MDIHALINTPYIDFEELFDCLPSSSWIEKSLDGKSGQEVLQYLIYNYNCKLLYPAYLSFYISSSFTEQLDPYDISCVSPPILWFYQNVEEIGRVVNLDKPLLTKLINLSTVLLQTYQDKLNFTPLFLTFLKLVEEDRRERIFSLYNEGRI